MTVEPTTMDDIDEKPEAEETRPSRKPAYVLAAEEDREAEEEERASAERAAFVQAAGNSREKPGMQGTQITGTRPGMKDAADPSNQNPSDPLAGEDFDPFTTDISGKGWIRCRDGKMIRDDGVSIFIPGKKLSPAQMEMVVQLSLEKGWTTLYAYKTNGKALHPEATQLLSSVIAASGAPLHCCTSQKEAGRLSHHLGCAADTIRQTQISRHEAEKQAAAAPAPAPQPA